MNAAQEFDRDEVLHRAMEVFWSRGYEGTSIEDLVKHMRINRQSIYDTFGDKHSLYLQSLERYCQLESRRALQSLENSASAKRAVRTLFADIVEGMLSDKERRGCFAGNALSELAGRCKATAARTSSNMAAMEDAFFRALLRGKREGELRAIADPRAVARFLCSSWQGLILMSKATQDRETLEDVVKVTLSVLD